MPGVAERARPGLCRAGAGRGAFWDRRRYRRRARRARRARLLRAFGGTAAPSPGRAPGTAVVVASFNFPESELLAAIYALALMQAGIPARLQLGLGPRELVQPALALGRGRRGSRIPGDRAGQPGAWDRRGHVRPVGGAAVSSCGPLPTCHVQVLQPAAAQDQDGLVVTGATAARLRLRSVSDLGPLRRRGSRRRARVRAAAVLPARAAPGIRPGVRQVRARAPSRNA